MHRTKSKTTRTRSAVLVAAIGLCVMAVCASSAAASVPLKTFAVPTADAGLGAITAGPDDNLWFTESTANKIGKITTSGTVTEYVIPTANSSPTDITAGPDGNVWFTESTANKIGMITPAGTVTEYPIPTANSSPLNITAGPDGNLWFTESTANKIGMITPTGTVTEYPIPTADSYPWGITAGPDGNLWFTENAFAQIGQITTAGVVTEYHAASEPKAITKGPDGNLWFVSEGQVCRFALSTHAVTGKLLFSSPNDIASGPGSYLWCPAGNYVARVSTSLAITKAHLKPSVMCAGVAKGPDGKLWFTENPGNVIGRLTPPVRKLSVSATVSFVRRSGYTWARFNGTAGPGLRGATLHLEWNEWYYVDLVSRWMWARLAYAPERTRIGLQGRFSVSLRVDRSTRYRVGHCWVEGTAGTTGWHTFTVR